jgi:hypothetical protein
VQPDYDNPKGDSSEATSHNMDLPLLEIGVVVGALSGVVALLRGLLGLEREWEERRERRRRRR